MKRFWQHGSRSLHQKTPVLSVYRTSDQRSQQLSHELQSMLSHTETLCWNLFNYLKNNFVSFLNNESNIVEPRGQVKMIKR